jgi:1,4-dihydroxy-2-naphthoate octaprenyltransferase
MSSPFVTLTHDDPEFRSYLLGSFSKELRALPVESFSQHSCRERITFRLVNISELKKPSWWNIYFKACRPELLGLTLGPFALTVAFLWRQTGTAPIYPVSVLLSACGLFFLHVAAFLFNDFRDHMLGVDLANRRRGSRVIQKGWASAKEVRVWAWVNAVLALVCGLPSVLLNWEELGPVILIAAAIVLALSWMPPRLARKGILDLLVFLGLGPLLTSAASITGFGEVTGQVVLVGVAFGALAMLTLQMRQLENLFRAGQDSFRTFIGAFDFDRARKCVLAQAVMVGALQILIAFQIESSVVVIVGFGFALLPLSLVFLDVRRAASPLSSDLVHIGRRAVLAQFALLLWWGASLWI